MILENPLLIIILTLLLGGFLGYFLREFLAKRKAQSLDAVSYTHLTLPTTERV